MQLDRSVSEGQDELRNTSFLERMTVQRRKQRFGSGIQKLLYYGCLLDIEKDEAERRNGEA